MTQFVSPHPSMGQRDQYQPQGAAQAPNTSPMGHIGQNQSVGRGRLQDLQAKSSGQAGQRMCYHCRQPGHMRRDCPRRQRSEGTMAEHTEKPDMQGTFLLLHLLTRVAFKLDASCSFINASCVIDLGLEVETFREIMGNSSLGCRVRVVQMCRDHESGISVILLMVDLKVVDILGVDVILDMDELIAIGLSVIGNLAGLSYPTRSWSWVRLHMYMAGCVCPWHFGTKFFLRRGECKTQENSSFLKNGKIVISVKIQNFSRSQLSLWSLSKLSVSWSYKLQA